MARARTVESEWDRMVRGELYDSSVPQLRRARERSQGLLREYAATVSETGRRSLLKELFGAVGHDVVLVAPFFCDYGTNIRLGDRVFFNANCVVLDTSTVTIGSDVMFGPMVQIYSATHPLEHAPRRKSLEYGKPITIGSDVWVGGGAIILPGVTIGDRAVIGAGAVVTKDVPAGVVVAGNPARVIRRIK